MGNQHERLKYRKRMLLLLLLILLGLFLQLFLESSPHGTKLKASTVSRINRYLQDAAKTHELRALQVQVENAQAEKINNDEAELASLLDADRKYGVDLVQDMHQEEVLEHTKGEDQMDLSDLPQEKIDARLLHHKWLNDYNKRMDKRYIETFLSNARTAGFEVILNDNLEVVAVRRMPQSLLGATEISNGASFGTK